MDGKFKIFVIVAIVVLALAIGGSTFLFMRAMNSNPVQTEAANDGEEKQPKVLKEIALGDAIMTNIAMEDNKIQHYAKIQISIGVDGDDDKAFEALSNEINEKSASIRNEIITAVGEQTYTMLSNTNKGKEKLSDEIITRLNNLLDSDMVKAVYYKDYFIQ